MGFQISQIINKFINTKLMGVNSANGAEGDALSYELDPQGRPVIRVVDAAPFAYDATREALKINVTHKKVSAVGGTQDVTLDVAAGATTQITIRPPVGELWRFSAFRLRVPPPGGATTGTHEFTISEDVGVASIKAKSAHSDQVSIYGTVIETASSEAVPSTEIAQQGVIQNLIAANNRPLTISYTNNTNAAQKGTFIIRMARLVEYIG